MASSITPTTSATASHHHQQQDQPQRHQHQKQQQHHPDQQQQQDNQQHQLHRVICISGKRKSGKDYFAKFLLNSLTTEGVSAKICPISEPLKAEYARINNLDLDRLLGDGAYKERYRADMVAWGEAIRSNDPKFFCEKAIASCDASVQVAIIPDCRRRSDLKYFDDRFGLENVIKVRLVCDDVVRRARSYVFTAGIDDCETECGLDDYERWDFVLPNDCGEGFQAESLSKTNDLVNTVCLAVRGDRPPN